MEKKTIGSIIGSIIVVLTLILSIIFGKVTPDETYDVLIKFEREPIFGASGEQVFGSPVFGATIEEENFILGIGGEVKHKYKRHSVIWTKLTEKQLEEAFKNSEVEYIEPNYTLFVEAYEDNTDPEIDNSWGVDWLDADLRHAEGITGSGITIAIVDTGIDYTHPDLDDNYVGGYDFFNEDSDPMDDHFHGTHVAGICCAEDNGQGVVGMAPDVSIYALKVCDYRGSCPTATVAQAIEWIIDPNGDGDTSDHIDVFNESLGSTGVDSAFGDELYWDAEQAGVIGVVSAGNAGPRTEWFQDDYGVSLDYDRLSNAGSCDKMSWPAVNSANIAVGATAKQYLGDMSKYAPYPPSSTLAYFSSGGQELEIVAPGYSIRSSVPLWFEFDERYGPAFVYDGATYGYAGGTSMAAPHVAGFAALILSRPGGVTDENGNGRINDEVRSIMISTAQDEINLFPFEEGWDEFYGFGIASTTPAMTASADLRPDYPFYPDTVEYLHAGIPYVIEVNGGVEWENLDLWLNYPEENYQSCNTIGIIFNGEYLWNNTYSFAIPTSESADDVYFDYLVFPGFGFDIPASANVTGILVEAVMEIGGSACRQNITDNDVRLVQNEVLVGENKARNDSGIVQHGNIMYDSWGIKKKGEDTFQIYARPFPYNYGNPKVIFHPGAEFRNYGGINDTWGLSLTGADVNDSNFGIAFQGKAVGGCTSSNVLATGHIDNVSMAIIYEFGGVKYFHSGVRLDSGLKVN